MDKYEQLLLLGHLVRMEPLLKEAVVRVNGYQLFDNMKDPECAIIWSAIYDCYKACKGMPSRILIRNELKNSLKFAKMLDPELILSTFEMLLDLKAEEFTEPTGRLLLDSALQEVLTTEWSKRISEASDLKDLKNVVTGINKDITHSGISKSVELDDYPLFNPEKYLKKLDRIPLGVHFWDEMSGGGIAPGEVFGLLGPTGGGKTVLSISVLIARAMRGMHVNMYQYEQTVEGDLMERMCTKITNMPITVFRNKGWDELSDDVKVRYITAVDKCAPYAHLISMAAVVGGGSGGSEEIIEHVRKCIKQNRKPSLIIIDWLGAMVQRYIALNNISGDQAYRRTAARFEDEIRSFCETEKIACILVHQLRTDEARASSAKKPKATDAHEHRAFSYNLDACYCLGTLDKETQVAWFVSDKHRRGPRQDVMIRLDGEMQEFSDANGAFVTDHRGRFIKKDGKTVPDGYAMMEDMGGSE